MEKRVEESLNDLGSSLESISSLVAWRDLKVVEQRPGIPPSFQMYDPTETEMKIGIGSFLKASTDIRIATGQLPTSKRAEVQRRLSWLETQFNQLLRTEKLK